MEQILLVDSFGVWEKHAGGSLKVRVINNFRSNKVNSFAWLPSNIKYDKLTELMEAMRVLKQYGRGKPSLGKSDFKSAFKTLSASAEQSWLSWCLIFNPEVGRHQVAPLRSQTFGSLGAVMAWYRTAMLLQHVLQQLFRVTTFIYVDDYFWACPDAEPGEGPNADWQACVFQYAVEELLGWKLNPGKTELGHTVTLLGLRVNILEDAAEWQLSTDKAKEWAEDILRFLQTNRLLPSEASKLCGRLAFLNSKIYGRVGRALLRPIIWRQVQTCGTVGLTGRLKNSLLWFLRALQGNWIRRVPYVRLQPNSQVIVYTDAESTGHIGIVFLYESRIWYGHADLPQAIRRRFKRRKTNILAYELTAAIVAILMLDAVVGGQVCVRHFIDNKPARSSLVAGHSKQSDLNELVGMVWHTAAHRSLAYWSDWVQSKANLADAPSRGDCQQLMQLGGSEITLNFKGFIQAADSWRINPTAASLMIKG